MTLQIISDRVWDSRAPVGGLVPRRGVTQKRPDAGAESQGAGSCSATGVRILPAALAKALRIELPGPLYPLTARGDGREDICLDDEDRELFLDLFGAVCKRLNGRCDAYRLVGNHSHLVTDRPDGNLARAMHPLNGSGKRRAVPSPRKCNGMGP
jgi:hypothetical protein